MVEQDRAKIYHLGKKRIFYFGLALDVVLLVTLQLSGLSEFFRSLSFRFAPSPLIAHVLYTFFFCFSFFLFQFPLSVFADYFWEHRFGLSRQTFFAWLTDEFKKDSLSFLLVLIVIEVVYALLGKIPQYWWIGAAGFWLFLSLVLARILPNWIIPLFYKYLKVENEDLRQRIFELFKKCNVTLKDIYAINLSSKTKKANAFVCGLGKTRRVVLSDTLLAEFTSSEIEAVVAHELGHYRHRDIMKLTVVNFVMIFAAFFMMDRVLVQVLGKLDLALPDIAGLPVFVLGMVIFGLVTTPLLNGYSRLLETEADRFSLTLTQNKEAFVSLMNKLGQLNLAEFSPSRFDEIMFYDHPPIARRIEFAQDFPLGGKINE